MSSKRVETGIFAPATPLRSAHTPSEAIVAIARILNDEVGVGPATFVVVGHG